MSLTVAQELAYLLIGAVVAVTYFVFASFVFGAGYQPTPRRAVRAMLAMARVGPDDRLIDLGAGTGAILFRAARQGGAHVVGVEVEPVRMLVLALRRAIGGPRERVELVWGNLFAVDLAQATVVTCFLWPGAMARLRPRFEATLAPGARIVSHWHRIPGWSPVAVDEANHVYLYRWSGRPEGAGGPAPSSRTSE